MPIAIKVENISKQYRLGLVGTKSLSHDLNRWWHLIRGKEDPYLKIGEINDRTIKGASEYVWALQNINFEIEQGVAIGIIGRNGAGKSTLLKILSRTTAPTKGSVKLRGRVASLLEVGTGFHPELSGRENIYLNGAILGMTRREITRKFDEIVDFSGVERYIDTPVKRYSSGMYVRLAFAVAAHLESEILIVDEVLAVGDAEFQKKCLGKMGEVQKGEGRTVIFVSHNLISIKSLCQNGIVMDKGLTTFSGSVTDAIANYYASTRIISELADGTITKLSEYNLGKGRFTKILIQNTKGEYTNKFFFLEKIKFYFEYESLDSQEKIAISIIIKDQHGHAVLMGTPGESYQSVVLDKGMNRFSFALEEDLMPGEYYVTLGCAYYITGSALDYNEDIISFSVSMNDREGRKEYPWQTIHGTIKPKSKVQIITHEH